jgi:predicted ArsR family transcriptional regulator
VDKPEVGAVREPASGARHAALAVLSRRRLLEALQASNEPLDVRELAAAVGLHITTARFHLDVLERAGLISRAAARAGRPGRPRQLYAAALSAEATEGHRQLAVLLAAVLAGDPDGGPCRAEQAGRWWADAQLPADEGLSEDQATRRVAALFDRVGFAPRPVSSERQRSLEMAACPFRDVARAHPEVVCSIHLGLLRGALRRSGLSAEQAGQAVLRPFVEPELCIADMPVSR